MPLRAVAWRGLWPAEGWLFWLFGDPLSASTDEDDDPLPVDYYSGLDFRFTLDILLASGHQYASPGGASLSNPSPPGGGVGANAPLVPAAAQTESQSPSGVSFRVFRQAASERIESVVERLFADKLGGLDLGPLVRGLSALDDLARAMASGTPAVIRASAAPTMLSGSPSSSPAASGQVGSGPVTGAAGFSARAPGPGGSEPTASDFFYYNMPPEVEDESYGIPHDRGFGESAPGVLSNDYDPDSYPGGLYAVLDQGPIHAVTFDLQLDGSFTYTPQPGYLGDDAFTYWVSDGMDYSLQTATAFLGIYNTPPVAQDGGGGPPYLTLHDTPLQISEANGVLANDFDPDGDPIQTVLKTGPGHAKSNFALNLNGSFYYEPVDGWVGEDTFTYAATDGIDESPPATVAIGVMNFAPTAENDGPYNTDAATSLVVVAPGVRANDWDSDGDPVTAVPNTGPSHGTLNYLNTNGSFKYTPDGTYVGTDTFTYYANDGITNSDLPATVSIDVVPDPELTIYHGQFGAAVPNALEESVGAFTVANGNDTDGDGVWDHVDTDGVLATPYGRDEVDLMKLIVHKPVPDLGGTVTVTVSDLSRVRLWEESTKVNEIAIDTLGQVVFATATLPSTVWVEITSPSNQLRDVQISTYYQGYGDTVTATGVWASLTAVEHERKTPDQLLAEPEWTDMTQPPKSVVQAYGGTGLIPNDGQDGIGVHNGIAMRYTVRPSGIGNEPNVNFDITRRKETRAWYVDAGGNITSQHSSDFPAPNEQANDDPLPNEDESDHPTANDYMFGFDAPGAPWDGPFGGDVLFVYRGNFEEFVRATFDGTPPAGNGVSGTRASGKYAWHSRHRLEDDPSGDWVRTTGDSPETDENDVGPGHIVVGTQP